jgi:hypothetical protein
VALVMGDLLIGPMLDRDLIRAAVREPTQFAHPVHTSPGP